MDKVSEMLEGKKKEVHAVTPETTVLDALTIMTQENIGVVMVVEDSRIRGIFSERDCVQELADRKECFLQEPIKNFMTSPVYFVTPDQTLEDCMSVMTARHIRHLPVLTGDELVGMISIGDVVKQLISERNERIKDLENFLWVNLI